MEHSDFHNKSSQMAPLKKRIVVNMNGDITSIDTKTEGNDEADFAMCNEIISNDPDLPLDFSRKSNDASPSSDHQEQSRSISSGSSPSIHKENMGLESPPAKNVCGKRFFSAQENHNVPSPAFMNKYILNCDGERRETVNGKERHPLIDNPLISRFNAHPIKHGLETMNAFNNTPLEHNTNISYTSVPNFPVSNLQAVRNGFYINNNGEGLSIPKMSHANLSPSSTNLMNISNDRRQKAIRPFKKFENEILNAGQSKLPLEITSDSTYTPNIITSPPLSYIVPRIPLLNEKCPSFAHGQSPTNNNKTHQEANGNVVDNHFDDSQQINQQQPDSQQNGRRKGQKLPDEQKDDAYWEKRRKNNEAAKRSRDARRAKEDQIASCAKQFLDELTIKSQENNYLRNVNAHLNFENVELQKRIRYLENLLSANHRADHRTQRSMLRIIEDCENNTPSPVAISNTENNPGL